MKSRNEVGTGIYECDNCGRVTASKYEMKRHDAGLINKCRKRTIRQKAPEPLVSGYRLGETAVAVTFSPAGAAAIAGAIVLAAISWSTYILTNGDLIASALVPLNISMAILGTLLVLSEP